MLYATLRRLVPPLSPQIKNLRGPRESFANIARGKEKNGNYIRVDTTTSDDKNYLNQQPKQLVSTTFRGPTPSAARKKNKLNRIESKLSPYFLANVHFLLYLCSVNH